MLAVTVEAAALKKAVPIIKSLVLSRSTIPILQCVKISVKNSVMEIDATNLDQGCKVSVAANGEGAWCLNFAKLQAVLSAIPDGAMIGISGDTIAKIESGKIKATIASMPVVDFPDLYKEPAESDLLLTVDADKFSDAFARTAWAVDDVRQNLKGVHIKHNLGSNPVVIEGCNGHVASRVFLNCPDAGAIDMQMPEESLAAISALAQSGEELKLYRNGGAILARVGNASWFSKLLDASYADIERMIAIQSTGSEASIFDVKALTAAIKSAASIDQDGKVGDRAIRLCANPDGAFVTGFGDAGEAFDVPVDCECSEAFEVWAQPSYVLGVLASAKAETIKVLPCETSILMPDTGNGFFGLVMQLRPRLQERVAA